MRTPKNEDSTLAARWWPGHADCLPPLAEFLSPARRNFYHQLLPITTLTRGLLIDVLLLGALAGIGFLLLDRAAPRLKQVLWLPVFFVAFWIAARNISNAVTDPMLRVHLLKLDALLSLGCSRRGRCPLAMAAPCL